MSGSRWSGGLKLKTDASGSIPGRIWDNAYAHIVGEATEELVDSGLFPPGDTPFVMLPADSPVFGSFHAMLELYRADPVRNRDPCLWHIPGIGLELKKYLETPECFSPLCREFVKLKRRIFAEPLGYCDFAAMAHQCRISEKHFARRFAEVIGLAPHNTVIHAKPQPGMERLPKNGSVKEAAAATGFNSASWFSAFRKYCCLSPGKMI